MEYITTFQGPPGLGTVDLFRQDVGGVFAMQGRQTAGQPETRTSTTFVDVFQLARAIRSEDDAALAWSPWS